MRKAIVALGTLAVLGGIGFWALTSPMAYTIIRKGGRLESVASADSTRAPDAEKGRILFYAGGCSSCHATPNQDDKLRLGGGYALKSPFGTFHVPNISSHPKDGIGSWDVNDFIRAMHEGVSPDGRHYYPAFPYTSYQRMSREDLVDLFAFLKTLPAVEGKVSDHELPFPFNIRRGVGLWKLVFLDGHSFTPDPAKSASWNRGAYLVNGPGHCAECHSERNVLGGIAESRRFAGGPNPEGRGTAPNITPDPSGIGGWTASDLVTLLTTGETPNFDTVGGPMGSVVRNTAQLPEGDRQAIAEYLLSLPPKDGYKAPRS